MRLAKYLAAAGVASRRAAEELIRAGRVTVDGEAVTDPARDVDDADAVAVDGEPVGRRPSGSSMRSTSPPASSRRPAIPRAGRPSCRWCPARCACIRSAGSTSTPPG